MKHDDPDSPALKLLASPRPLVIGHRGCCAFAPENTLPSFQLALEAGADLVEFDYHHSQDGVPMAIHDDLLDRTTDARKQWRRRRTRVADKTAAEIESLDAGSWFDQTFAKTRVPRLIEAVEFIRERGGVPLIEHKSGDAQTCVRLLREHGLINQVVIISFDWLYLRQLRELEPRQLFGALGPKVIRMTDGRKPPRRGKPLNALWLDDLEKTGARLVVWNRQVPSAAVQLAHERGLKAWVYTVNDVGLARDLVARGVDGIITNDVRLIRGGLHG